jgi:hypothetical protein
MTKFHPKRERVEFLYGKWFLAMKRNIGTRSQSLEEIDQSSLNQGSYEKVMASHVHHRSPTTQSHLHEIGRRLRKFERLSDEENFAPIPLALH